MLWFWVALDTGSPLLVYLKSFFLEVFSVGEINKAQGLDCEISLDNENNRSCVAASQAAAIIFMCVKGRDGLWYKKKWGLVAKKPKNFMEKSW